MRCCTLNLNNRFDVESHRFLFPVVKGEVIVKHIIVHRQITPQNSCMCCKHNFNIQIFLANSRNSQPGHPFMKMCNYSACANIGGAQIF